VVRQIDDGNPEPAQKFKPVVFFLWLAKQLDLAEEVVVCYEAGCFGYHPARRMQKLGVKVYVIAPQNWGEQGKRQVNDKHDAQVICRRLSEYLAGHEKAWSIVRIPSPQEEERRARGRLREQFQRELRRVQAIGRSLLLNWEMPVRGRWWTQLSWPGMVKAVPKWVITQLESWKPIVEAIEEQLGKIEAELRAAAPRQLIFGESELTHELLARELIDPARFRNSRQVGNYFGLCPSESASAERRRLGAITKHAIPGCAACWLKWPAESVAFSQITGGWAAGERCSRIAQPAPWPVRKPSWPWRVNSPSISGESPPDQCAPKNLA
jgi:transposase